MDAASFLKKSQLSDEILGKVIIYDETTMQIYVFKMTFLSISKIWEMSDPQGKGFLDKQGLFVACKLVALVQCEQPLTVDNARVECKAPNFGPVDTAPGAPVAQPGNKVGAGPAPMPVKNALNFLVKPDEKRKYDALFDQLQPQDEKLPGDKVSHFHADSFF